MLSLARHLTGSQISLGLVRQYYSYLTHTNFKATTVKDVSKVFENDTSRELKQLGYRVVGI